MPCRAAMYAKFPLHGTYFQTNEVFLDAATAVVPTMVLTRRLEFLPTVNVFLGSRYVSGLSQIPPPCVLIQTDTFFYLSQRGEHLPRNESPRGRRCIR